MKKKTALRTRRRSIEWTIFFATAMSALLAGVFFSALPTARAWNPINSRWSTWCGSVPYAAHEAGSADLGVQTSHAEVRRAFSDWQAVSCADLTISEGPVTSTRPGVYEGRSIVGWVESGWRHSPEAIGVTANLTTQNVPSCVTEADMELNGVHYTWITNSGGGAQVNAYSILLHEGGHYLGLGHSNDRDATMYFAYQGGIDTISSDDRAGICSLYPSPDADCTTLGCPGGQQCVSGKCEFIEGDGTLCAPCQADDDCGGPNDYCLSYPDEIHYCGRFCQSDADCPADNEFCARTTSLSQCARVNDDGDFDCSGGVAGGCQFDTDCGAEQRCENQACVARSSAGGGLGDSCSTDADCRDGLCAPSDGGRVCSRTCDWLEASSCEAPGSYCAATATGTCGIGVCLLGVAGAGADGASCARDTDCQSLYCIEERCRVPCSGGTTALCPPGTQCLSTPLSGCGACAPPKELGDPCRSFEECPNRLCAEEENWTYCTKSCAEDADCPEDFACKDAGNLKVCRPPEGYRADAGIRSAGGGGGDRGGCGCSTQRPTRQMLFILCIFAVVALGRLRRA